MRNEEPKVIYLKDYQPSRYLVDSIHLEFTLDPKATRVVSKIKLHANPKLAPAGDLTLDGDELKLISIAMNGQPLARTDFEVSPQKLTIRNPPEQFSLRIETEIAPAANTKLSGLYQSQDLYCTQCEAEGFRRITYYLDRPDVLSVFTTRIIASKSDVPVLLSNGNETARGDLPGGKHFAEWHDPHPKPSYLFALAAGKLGVLEDAITTKSGRNVRLRIFVEPGNEPKVEYAMGALKRSMRWDEETFGLEYDLDDFMIVAVSAFNAGAMENKGLNIFNSALLLASPDTATDAEYERIESVIAHEYFHNWTGDRVTCRDWFQLSLKEGLTVYRDQIFTADMRDAAVKRIDDVRLLRARQFKEDDGPLAHPPRPASFIEIENFYTTTVYEKGAEICRMIERLVGKEGFRKGMDLYFQRNDGTAATVEDFIAAFADANGRDFTQFARWYNQAGRPRVRAETRYDEAARALDLTLTQETLPTPGQPVKAPLHIPVAVGFLDEAGRDIPLRLEGENKSAAATTRIVELKEPRTTFRFIDMPRPQGRSLLRGFSSPVTLELESTAEEDAFLFAHDSDPFNRWEAGQRYARRILFEGAKAWRAGKPLPRDPKFIEAMRRTLLDQSLEPAYKSLALMLPTVSELAQAGDAPIDYEALYESRQGLRAEIGQALGEEFQRLYDSESRMLGAGLDGESAGRRSLVNTALAYLVAADEARAPLAYAHYTGAKTMTDRMAALTILANLDAPEREKALADFYERFKNDGLVMEKWLRTQALSTRKETLSEIKRLTSHPAFDIKNPNRVRSLIGAYAHSNPYRFYTDGKDGFDFLGDTVLKLDPINPKIAANLISALESWRKLPPEQQAFAKATLARVKNTEGLSRHTFEIASKCLGEV